MNKLHLGLLGFWVALALYISSWRASSRPRLEPSSAVQRETEDFDIVLPGAALLVTLDLQQLRADHWGRSLLESISTRGASEAVPFRCAARALDTIDRLALVAPAESLAQSSPEVAVVAHGRLVATDLLRCAQSLIDERGGAAVESTLGGFRTLRDRHGHGELAVRDGGPLILSGGTYFRDLVDRASGNLRAASSVQERLHLALRRDSPRAPLVVTWVLPPRWLEAWLGEPSLAGSALAEVRALSLSAHVQARLSVQAALSATSAESAERIETQLRGLRPSLERNLGPAFDPTQFALSTRRDEARVLVFASAPTLALAAILAQPSKR